MRKKLNMLWNKSKKWMSWTKKERKQKLFHLKNVHTLITENASEHILTPKLKKEISTLSVHNAKKMWWFQILEEYLQSLRWKSSIKNLLIKLPISMMIYLGVPLLTVNMFFSLKKMTRILCAHAARSTTVWIVK